MGISHVDREVVFLPLSDLKPRARNARTHSRRQVQQIADSIRNFGFVNPVLVERDGTIIAGHGRVEGAKLAGLKEIPTLTVDHLTPAQIRAYVIADNKLALNAGWDNDLLALELKELTVELDFDIRVTGFETPEIDLILQPLDGDDAPEDLPPIDDRVPAVSRPGDLWQIGPHRLFCGDATQPESFHQLMGGDLARLVFTDPPYNVPIDGHVCGSGKIKHPEFAMATGEMDSQTFAGFLETSLRNLADASLDGSIHYVCMDWRHMGEVLRAGKAAYTEYKNLCVWTKTNAGMGSFYRSQHELVFVFKKGAAAHVNNLQLGKHGRNRSNVWSYAGQNSFGQNRDQELASHPTVKPIDLVADAIADASHRGEIVLDAFAGSGTTLLAAQKTGRRGFGIEISPHYVDLVIKRFRDKFGIIAEHSGRSFDKVAAARKRGRAK